MLGFDDDPCVFGNALAEERSALGGRRSDLRQHSPQLYRVGPHQRDALLCTRQSRPSNHFHGTRDLLRRFDATDALANTLEVCHGILGSAGDELGTEIREDLLQFLFEFGRKLALFADPREEARVLFVE